MTRSRSHHHHGPEEAKEGTDSDSIIGAFAGFIASLASQTALLNDFTNYLLLIFFDPTFLITCCGFGIAVIFSLIIAGIDAWCQKLENFVNQPKIKEEINALIEEGQQALLTTRHNIMLSGHRVDEVLNIAGAPAALIEIVCSVFQTTIPSLMKVAIGFVGLILGIVGSRSELRNTTTQIERFSIWEKSQQPKAIETSSSRLQTRPV